ncbi:hypothetical protein [Paenibacillus puerhi]|uniref:hypothetical protein n=1 Tax=Paenibacillus puerhi TaxID=2692622 RepID=UPI00135CC740|nr:hypothetical protein [Paenibacillus puerhi]
MSRTEAENRAKLHMLVSLARSQRALARMLESMAELMEAGARQGRDGSAKAGERMEGGSRERRDMAGREWLAQLEALSRYQRAMAERLGLLRLRKIRRGIPGKPWLSHPIRTRTYQGKERRNPV